MEEPLDEEPEIDWNGMKTHVTDYVKNRVEYVKLSVIEYVADITESVVLVIILSVIFLTLWVFANFTAAIAIGEAVGRTSIGFLIITGFNLLLGIILVVARKALILKPVSSMIIKILTKSLKTDEDK